MPGKFSHEQNSSMEIVFQDTEGDRIHASIRSGFIARHRTSLHEGKTYVVSHLSVVPNTGAYRTTDHPYRVNFQYSTLVRPCVDDGHIHRYGFSFRSFSQILAPQFDDRYLVDVIGKLTAVGSLDECIVNSRRQHRVDVELMDEEMEHLECTLWGAFADQVLQFMSHSSSKPIIVIIQWCKVREFSGHKKISNSMFTSRLLVHPSVAEVDHFIHKLHAVGVDVNQEPNRIAPHAILTLADDLLAIADRRKLRDLRSGPADVVTIVLAELVNVHMDQGWSYTSCKRCGKKVVPDGESFFCDKCAVIVKFIVPRFMVRVEAHDDTATCNLVIFDREFSKLVGCSAVEMKEKMLALPTAQLDDIGDGLPMDVVEKIVGKRYLMKIKVPEDYVKCHSNACVILRMTADEDIINAYLSALNDDSGSDNLGLDDRHEDQVTEVALLASEGASSSVVAATKRSNVDVIATVEEEEGDRINICAKKKLKIESSQWAAP